MLGPPGDEDKDKDDPQRMGSHPPSGHPFAHNAFHVWDQDDVVIPLSRDESPQTSPLLLAAIPYIPSFFPHSHSPPSHGSPGFPNCPETSKEIPGEFWLWHGPWLHAWVCITHDFDRRRWLRGTQHVQTAHLISRVITSRPSVTVKRAAVMKLSLTR